MADNNPPPSDRPAPTRPPLRASRWSRTPTPPPGNSNRMLFRLIGLPALAVAGVLIYRGIEQRFTLPACDSTRAKATLADVLKQLKLGPLRDDDPINTISTSKQQVSCNVALPVADGGTINIDYAFFWQDNRIDMRYSLSRRPAEKPAAPAQDVPQR